MSLSKKSKENGSVGPCKTANYEPSDQELHFSQKVYLSVGLKAFMLKTWVKYSAETYSLRKHAYANILKFLPPKNENF